MVKDTNFGSFVRKLRKEQHITLSTFSYGLCDIGHLSRIEHGKVKATKLLRDRLLGRLGIAAENYENFLYYNEYKCWRERQDVVYSILYGKIEKARQLLEDYQKRYSFAMKQTLESQFYWTMLAQIRKYEGATNEELAELFQKAVNLTIPEPIKKELKSRMLSIEELNLLLEYAFYNAEEVSLEWYKEFIDYVEQLPLDRLALSKIYPKLIYYLYQHWRNKGSIGTAETSKILYLCNKAIEVLQKGNRMFYLWELLEMKKQLLQDLIEQNRAKGEAVAQKINKWYEECSEWQEVLTEVYEEYGVSKQMQDFCYIYLDMEVHCIGDVIKTRRNMLKMTMKELSEGICTERTVSRLEHNATEPQQDIVLMLFKRLNMATEFCRTDLLVEDPKAKTMFAELKQSNNKKEFEKVELLLKQVKTMAPLEIPENRQAIRRNEVINEYNKKVLNAENFDKQEYIQMLKEALEYTIPYKIAVASGQKYLTQSELACLQNLMKWLDWSYPEMEESVKSLYDLFEHQRRIEDCLNMYEFIMGAVASHLGNNGKYDLSDEIEIKILKNSLMTRRFGIIYRVVYELLWNDVQRKKEQHPVKRDVDVKKELKKCIRLCEMSGNLYHIPFFEERLETGIG